MTATMHTRMGARDIAHILKALSRQATPAPWSSFDGHVSATDASETAEASHGRNDPETRKYYGGLLVCESCDSPDAVLIAAMRNMLPALIDGYFNALEDAEHFERRLRTAEAKATDAEHLVDLVRSQRYAPLQYPPAHVMGIRYHPHGWSGWQE